MADIIRLQAHVKEHYTRKLLKSRNCKVFSPDWVMIDNGEMVFVEVKQKTTKVGIIAHKWEEGGHGFETYQYNNYLDVYDKFGIRTLVLFYDMEDGKIYEQYVDVLREVEDTFMCNKGKIIAWSIKNFNVSDA